MFFINSKGFFMQQHKEIDWNISFKKASKENDTATMIYCLNHGTNPLIALYYTLVNDNEGIVSELIKAKRIEINRPYFANKCTALHVAGSHGSQNTIRELLKNGAKTDILNGSHFTPRQSCEFAYIDKVGVVETETAENVCRQRYTTCLALFDRAKDLQKDPLCIQKAKNSAKTPDNNVHAIGQ